MKKALLCALLVPTFLFGVVPSAAIWPFLYFQKAGDGGTMTAVFNATLLIVFCISHSLLARKSVKKQVAKWVGEDYVTVFYVWVAGIVLSAALLLWRPLDGELWHVEGIAAWLLTGLFVATAFGAFYAFFLADALEFAGLRGLVRKIKDEPVAGSPVFTTAGLYGYCRHPGYVFTLLAYWVGPVMTYGRLEFAIVFTAYTFIGARFEERNLRDQFGEVYDLYRANVPMWIPRLKPWRYEK